MNREDKPHLIDADLPVPPAHDQVRCAHCGRWINRWADKCCYCGINFFGEAGDFHYDGPVDDPYDAPTLPPLSASGSPAVKFGAVVLLVIIILHFIAFIVLGILTLIA